MIPVAVALDRILAGLTPLPGEIVPVSAAAGRVLAGDLTARRTQPPAAMSAMDGWAVRSSDIATLPATLRRIGTAPAGSPFAGTVGSGDAVRIFTGGLLPDGADTVVLQEDCDDQGDRVTVRDGSGPGRWVRPAGLDFRAGQVGLRTGRLLTARDAGLAAAMDIPWLEVRRRPRVAILATGNEVVRPGEGNGPGQVVNSNTMMLAALVRRFGGEPQDLGIAGDEASDLRRMAIAARGADFLVTSGGASVGEHDLVRNALGQDGLSLDFWKVAMRPGKPLMFGHLNGMPVLGLPGNPVSGFVCALLFLVPALRVLQGLPADPGLAGMARLGFDLPANDGRQDYLRASRSGNGIDGFVVMPFPRQDSSMLRTLAAADCLIVRPPLAPAAQTGESVDILHLPD